MRLFAILLATMLAAGVAAFGSISVGCGSSSKPTPAKDSGVAEAGDAAPDVAMVDSGPSCQQDANTYPAPHHPIPQVDNLGGPIIKSPVIVTVTFNYNTPDGGTVPADGGEGGAADAGAPDASDPLASTFEKFGDVITGTTWWMNAVGGYGIGPGTGGGHVRLPDSQGAVGSGMPISGSSIDDSQVQAFIQQEVTAGTLPEPTSETLYALYFPASTTISLQGGTSCVDFGGYHGSTMVTDPMGASFSIAYAVLPRCNFGEFNLLDQTTFAASHEFAEAASDPQGGAPAYYLFSNASWPQLGQGTSGGEIGDLCNTPNATPYHDLSTGYAVQRIWSNKAAAASEDPCEPTDDYPQPYIYFNAAVETQSLKMQGTNVDGYAIVKRGTTVSLPVVAFSTAKLPAMLGFTVGVPPMGLGAGSGALMPPPLRDGTMVSVSLQEGQNGDCFTVDISVPTTAPVSTGNQQPIIFVVRSTLQDGTGVNYHDWPVILHVE